MDDHTERVRRRAYQIWLDEGRPEGREEIHWDMAAELVAIEENQRTTTKRVGRDSDDPSVAADRAEPWEPAAAMGEMPTMTDTGEQSYPPQRNTVRAMEQPEPDPSQAAASKPATKPLAARSSTIKSAAAGAPQRSSWPATATRRDQVARSGAERVAGTAKPGSRGTR